MPGIKPGTLCTQIRCAAVLWPLPSVCPAPSSECYMDHCCCAEFQLLTFVAFNESTYFRVLLSIGPYLSCFRLFYEVTSVCMPEPLFCSYPYPEVKLSSSQLLAAARTTGILL